MSDRDFEITGSEVVARAIKELPARLAKKVIRQAIRGGMKKIAAAARVNAPVLTGQTKAAIKVRAMKRKTGRIGVVTIVGKGDYKGDQFYASFVEYGTVNMPAKPFMRPAFDAHAEESTDMASLAIVAGIEREAAALRAN